MLYISISICFDPGSLQIIFVIWASRTPTRHFAKVRTGRPQNQALCARRGPQDAEPPPDDERQYDKSHLGG